MLASSTKPKRDLEKTKETKKTEEHKKGVNSNAKIKEKKRKKTGKKQSRTLRAYSFKNIYP
jgi:hypothetical protein